MLSLAFALANWFKLWPISVTTILVILLTGILASLGSMALGFMLYYTGDYSGDLIIKHYWGAIFFTASLCLGLFWRLEYERNASRYFYWLFVAFLVMANGALIYTSHQGGSLTHGDQYLTEYMPDFGASNDKQKPVADMLVFDDMITPLLKRKCMSCHNENKSKGGLIMTTYNKLMKGGSGQQATVVPHASAESDLYRRVILPANDDDKMPPAGKPGLTPDEIKLLGWWIDQGASDTLRIGHLSGDSVMGPMIEHYANELRRQQQKEQRQLQALNELITSVSNNRCVIRRDPAEPDGIQVSMVFPLVHFDDNDLQTLEPAFEKITKVSLVGSDITDDSFYAISQMTSLRELYLQHTRVTGSDLPELTVLSDLKILDLSDTKITDANLLMVLQFPGLEELFVNNTAVSEDVVRAIMSYRPELKIHRERGALF